MNTTQRREIDFDYIIQAIQKDIDKFEQCPVEFPWLSTEINAVILESLRHQLDMIKQAIRVERDRMQSIMDMKDSFYYDKLSRRSRYFDNDFRVKIDECYKALTNRGTQKNEELKTKKWENSDCLNMASRLNRVADNMTSTQCQTSSQKLELMARQKTLRDAAKLLTNIANS